MKVLTVLGTRVVGLYPHLCASRCLLLHDMVQSVHGYYQQRRRKTFAHGIEPPTVGLGKEQPSWGAQRGECPCGCFHPGAALGLRKESDLGEMRNRDAGGRLDCKFSEARNHL